MERVKLIGAMVQSADPRGSSKEHSDRRRVV